MNEKELWDFYGDTQKDENVEIGPYSSYQFLNSRRHLLYTIARYKFAMKIIGENKRILDLGCNDGFGTYFLGEFASKLVGVDFDEKAISWAKKQKSLSNIEFKCENFFKKEYWNINEKKFDAIVSFDVIEHIYPQNENEFMNTVIKNLEHNGIFIIGTPSLEANQYSKENISGAHVNLYTGETLNKMLNKYFNNVFMFTQNDEIIHTGHFRMANYLLAVCCYKKNN